MTLPGYAPVATTPVSSLLQQFDDGNVGPYVENHSPVGPYRPLDAHITFDILDEVLSALEPDSVVITVEGQVVFQNEIALLGYLVGVTVIPNGRHYDVTAPAAWTPGVVVDVDVDASDGNDDMDTFSWQFIGTTVGLEICSPAALLTVEERLRTSMTTPALELLRRKMLEAVSTDTMLDHRIRGILLTANQNDFKIALADVLVIPAVIQTESICKRRRLYDVDADVQALSATLIRTRDELRSLGLSTGYRELLETRSNSTSPQYRVSAACATLIFASILLTA